MHASEGKLPVFVAASACYRRQQSSHCHRELHRSALAASSTSSCGLFSSSIRPRRTRDQVAHISYRVDRIRSAPFSCCIRHKPWTLSSFRCRTASPTVVVFFSPLRAPLQTAPRHVRAFPVLMLVCLPLLSPDRQEHCVMSAAEGVVYWNAAAAVTHR